MRLARALAFVRRFSPSIAVGRDAVFGAVSVAAR